MRIVFSLPLTAVILAVGCSDAADTADRDTATDTDATGAALDPTGAAPPPECLSSPSPDASDPLATGSSCDGYDDQAATLHDAPVSVRFVNKTAAPLLVHDQTSGCRQPARYFDLEGTASDRRLYAPDEHCPTAWPSCASLMGQSDGCPICATIHPPIYLSPGGWMQTSWSGRLLAEAVLPSDCAAEGDDPRTCSVVMQASHGAYVVTAEARRAEPCEPGFWCPEIGTCAGARLDEHGACVLTGLSIDRSVDVIAEAAWNGICDQIEVVFGDI